MKLELDINIEKSRGEAMEVVGIDEKKVKKISSVKREDDWVLDYRTQSYHYFEELPMPSFGPSIDLDFSKIIYY